MFGERIVRKLLQRYWRLSRGLTLGARGIVADAEGRVLLIRHTYARGWLLPGGGVEFGESLLTALKRELEEEAGVLPTAEPEMLGIYENSAAFPGDHVAIFVVRDWRRDRIPPPNREIAESGFFAPDALPDETTAGTRRRIEEWLGQRPRSEIW